MCNLFLNSHKKNKSEVDRQIRFYNCWEQDPDDMYWNRFIKNRNLLKNYPHLKIGVFSVFGERTTIDKVKNDICIFFTGENVKHASNIIYADHLLSNRKVDLSIGFELFEDERFVRFPLWMDYMFEPESTKDDIIAKCAKLRHPEIENKDKFACLIARHDHSGIRSKISQPLMKIDKVYFPGIFMHNDDDLQIRFMDNKHEYMRGFRFNVCPENSNCEGYVTEKIFQAIESGCIPIYWGSNNHPEINILNQDAIIFWDPNGDNQNSLEFIESLNQSPNQMKDFLSQPRLLPHAEEIIIDTFYNVEKKIREIIAKKVAY